MRRRKTTVMIMIMVINYLSFLLICVLNYLYCIKACTLYIIPNRETGIATSGCSIKECKFRLKTNLRSRLEDFLNSMLCDTENLKSLKKFTTSDCTRYISF